MNKEGGERDEEVGRGKQRQTRILTRIVSPGDEEAVLCCRAELIFLPAR